MTARPARLAMYARGLALAALFSTVGGATQVEAAPTRRVVGYLPEWSLAKKTWELPLLSDVMVFSGGVNSIGGREDQ